ncbi:MAG: A24 family peptidase [Anaerolineae bacterium]|nr:A24 family peptidase [Anaerolineae bacterium]MDW8298268.1 A24 family peptidase [Anaerolineae bacterium]
MVNWFVPIAALFGLLIGGVVNWLADYLPYTARLGAPRYPDGTPRPRVAWLGVSAFLLNQRSAPSGTALSLRHPLTEIILAALFAYVASQSAQDVLRALFLMGNVAILVLITVIDLEHRMILYLVVVPSCLYALLGAALLGERLAPSLSFTDYLIGGAVGFGLFFVMYLGGILFNYVASSARGAPITESAFGDGDVLLATLSGFMLGWQALIYAAMIAVFLGGLGAFLYLGGRLLVRGRYEWFTALPYGQYIVFGTLIMLLWRIEFLALLGVRLT